MNKKIIAGILLSLALVYLSVRGINLDETIGNLKEITLLPVVAFIGIILVMQFLRSYRWGVIMSPLRKIDQFSLFAVTSVGFLAIAAIPARLGELARPYLISQKSEIKFSSALGTIFVERVLDSLAIISIMVISLAFMDLPAWMVKSSILFFIFAFAMLLFIIFLIWKRQAALNIAQRVFRKMPGKMAHKIEGLVHHFIEGFKIITDMKMLFYLLFISALIWLVDVLAIYMLFLAFDFDLPFLAAVVLMIVLIAGIAIPTAPGYIGNWHFACILGLSIFGVAKSEAFSFAIVYHFLSIAIVVVLGILFMPYNKFSLKEIKALLNGEKAKNI